MYVFDSLQISVLMKQCHISIHMVAWGTNNWLIDCCLISSLPRSITAIVMTRTIRHLGRVVWHVSLVVEQDCFLFQSTWFHPQFLWGILFSVLCFVFQIVVCSFYFGYYFFLFFNLQLLIDPLVPSNLS